MRFGTGLWPVLFFGLCLMVPLQSPGDDHTPVISIIIDDMGKREAVGQRVLALPGPVACAFLPGARYTRELAAAAYERGKEVMLHLPMATVDGHRLDAGAVTLHMTERQFRERVQTNLAAVPHVQGVNNHMGSLLTRHPGAMLWLMQEMQQHPALFFVDSRTTAATVARQIALENGVPSTERNVFLDNQLDRATLEYEFERLLGLARRDGSAVAIGHPHAETLALLERRLPGLREQGIRLVPVSRIIKRQQDALIPMTAAVPEGQQRSQ